MDEWMTNVPTAWFPAHLLCEMSKTSFLYSSTCHGYSVTWLVISDASTVILAPCTKRTRSWQWKWQFCLFKVMHSCPISRLLKLSLSSTPEQHPVMICHLNFLVPFPLLFHSSVCWLPLFHLFLKCYGSIQGLPNLSKTFYRVIL